MELKSKSYLAKELYNKVIFPIQTKNDKAQEKYDENNKKLEEKLISQREQEESKKKAAIEGIKAIAAEKAQREAAKKEEKEILSMGKEIALGILGMKMGIKDFLLLTVMEN